jgi:TRAP-type C4-dicarboxylate transport system substrate-binding protein
MTISNFIRWLLRFIPIAAALVAVSVSAAHGATLKIATLSPEGSVWMKLLRKHGKTIEQRTEGAVKLKFYPGGVMGDDKAVLRKMRVGQLHGAVMTAGGLVQTYPDIALYNLPLLFHSDAEIDHVRAALDERLMAGLREKKFVGFGFAEVGFAYPMTQQPAASVAQMQQLRVWTPDNDLGSLRAFEAFDISPIPLPIADVLAGLQTGLIDSVASPPIGTIALQWHTQVQHGLELPLLYVYGLFTLAEKPFAKLTAAQQVIVSEELRIAVHGADIAARRDHLSAKNALIKQGIVWQQPSQVELQEWLDLASEARQRLIANGYVSADLYQQTLDLLAEFRATGG